MGRATVLVLAAACIATTLCVVGASGAASSSAAAAGDMVFFVFTRECFATFFEKQDFLNQECLKIAISKTLGYGIVVGSSILKVPQLYNILSSRSVAGISSAMVYAELLSQMLNAVYNVLQGHPLSTYGESVIISVQNVLIIALIWAWAKPAVSLPHVLGVVLVMAASTATALNLPSHLWATLLGVSTLINISGRLPQIVQNHRSKSTGQLSLITVFLTFAGCIARVFTSISDAGDQAMALGFVIAAVLNLTMLVQILMYWASAPSAAAATKKAKRKKAD